MGPTGTHDGLVGAAVGCHQAGQRCDIGAGAVEGEPGDDLRVEQPDEHLLAMGGVGVLAIREAMPRVGGDDRVEHRRVRTGRIVAGEGTGRRINAGTWHPCRFITLAAATLGAHPSSPTPTSELW